MKPRRGLSGWRRVGGVPYVTSATSPATVATHKAAFQCDKDCVETVVLEHLDGRRKVKFIHLDGTFHDTDAGVIELIAENA